MKKRVLLIDESLTVQKVVALTLDKSRHVVSYAKSRAEAMAHVADSPPDVILVSDQVTDITTASFPHEVSGWLGGVSKPAIILITSQDGGDQQNYDAVLKKPFSPQALQSAVSEHGGTASPVMPDVADFPIPDDDSLQKRFNDTFNDEASLVRQTFEPEVQQTESTLTTIPAPPARLDPPPRPSAPQMDPPPAPSHTQAPSGGDGLWNSLDEVESTPPLESEPPRGVKSSSSVASQPDSSLMGAEDSMAYKASLESQVKNQLERQDLNKVVADLLERMLPPIVERMVQERLDKLLSEQEDFADT